MIQFVTSGLDSIDLALQSFAKTQELGIPDSGAAAIEFLFGHNQFLEQLKLHLGEQLVGHTAAREKIEGLRQRVFG